MEDIFILRKATKKDTERIWQIIRQAKEQMRRLNSQQWQNGYPALENITTDIANGCGYVLCLENQAIAYGMVTFDGEDAYRSLEGKWINDEPYVVLHRLAVADEMKKRGIATLFVREVEKLSRQNKIYNFRVDTNFDNHYMLKMLSTLGFSYCGEINYENAPRMAYQKTML